jgi:hypothetical protein
MQLFLHTTAYIRIISGLLEWQGTPAEFAVFEPNYPGLPVVENQPIVVRYATPELTYLETASGQRYADSINALTYCNNVYAYLTNYPAIYVHVTLDQDVLNVDDANDRIVVNAAFKASGDPNAPNLPVNNSWIIKLRHADGTIQDSFLATFVDGAGTYNYRYKPGLPLGPWELSEADFVAVTVGNQTYRVKLAAPVQFTLYRTINGNI